MTDENGGDPGDVAGPATRAVLDSVFARIRAGDPPDSLFGLLTSIYRDAAREEGVYDGWHSTVRSTVGDAESVLVVECGVGGLLARLADDYPSVVGVDHRPGLPKIAGDRTGVPVAIGTLDRPPVRRRVDAVVGFGHALSLAGVDPDSVFRALRPLVRPGGCVVLDAVAEARTLLDPSWVDEVAGYRASYALTAAEERGDVAKLGVRVELTDVESGETAVATPQLDLDVPGRDTLTRELTSAGFDTARVEPYQTGEGGLFAVGRVPGR